MLEPRDLGRVCGIVDVAVVVIACKDGRLSGSFVPVSALTANAGVGPVDFDEIDDVLPLEADDSQDLFEEEWLR